MNEQQTNPTSSAGAGAAGSAAAHERCLCYEVLDLFRSRLGVSPRVKQHLNNSRVEFLKAIREVIDERIEHLSKPAQQGTRIRVE
jgi:hypothetical protein